MFLRAGRGFSPVNHRFLSTISTLPKSSPDSIFVTTPIFYVNDEPHLGHLYSVLLADSVSRWKEFQGNRVFLSTGCDEHGIKVQQAAKSTGNGIQKHCDKFSSSFQKLFDASDIGYSRFIRTTDPDHKRAVQAFWKKISERGYIEKSVHSGWYCVSDEMFVPENQTVGAGSHRTTLCGKTVEWTEEENYVLKLSKLQNHVAEWLNTNPECVYPKQYEHQVWSWLKEPLPDLSISRPASRQHWGIPVPDDPTQTIYVWMDALVNYLTVTGYPETWNENSIPKSLPIAYHILGKDILKFHAIYWPSMLFAAGMPLPPKLIVHGHWTVNHVKMSKSLGNRIDPYELLSTFGVDGTRYALLRDGALNYDADFSMDIVKMRYQIDLADQLGNLVSRTLALLPPEGLMANEGQTSDDTWTGQYLDLPDKVKHYFDCAEISKGLQEIMLLVQHTNQYLSRHEPWKIKDDMQRRAQYLHAPLLALRRCGLLLQPVMPSTMSNLLKGLSVPQTQRNWSGLNTPAEIVNKKKIILFPRLSTSETAVQKPRRKAIALSS